MNVEQILQMIDKVSASKITEFCLETPEGSLSLKKGPGLPLSVEQASSGKSSVLEEESALEKEAAPMGNQVEAPLVGTFYAGPSPEGEPFVKVGDQVKKGQVLGIIEAMKLMNEVESDYDGTVEAVLVKNEQMVEYGQPLFVIR